MISSKKSGSRLRQSAWPIRWVWLRTLSCSRTAVGGLTANPLQQVHQLELHDNDGVSRRNDVWAPVSLYFLWILMWLTRPILAVNFRPQSSQVNGLVSVDSAAGTDWLVEPFRRLRFSTAVAMRTSSKCCIPVRQAFRHLDLLPARSWITYYST